MSTRCACRCFWKGQTLEGSLKFLLKALIVSVIAAIGLSLIVTMSVNKAIHTAVEEDKIVVTEGALVIAHLVCTA